MQLLAATGTDAADVGAHKLRSVRRLVLLTLACEAWASLTVIPYSSHPGRYGLIAAGLVVCAVVGFQDRFARPALAAAGGLLLFVVASAFPENANHQFLALVVIAVVLLVRPRSEADTQAALQSLRWIALLGIAWAGVMKLVYGYWLGAEFLSWRIAQDPGFANSLGLLLPEGELARLVGLGAEVGAGPFRTHSPALVAISNLTWLGELVLPALLLWAPARWWATGATVALFIAIQLGAREVFFGGLMVGLVLLFARGDATARALPWTAAVYLAWLLRHDVGCWMAT